MIYNNTYMEQNNNDMFQTRIYTKFRFELNKEKEFISIINFF